MIEDPTRPLPPKPNQAQTPQSHSVWRARLRPLASNDTAEDSRVIIGALLAFGLVAATFLILAWRFTVDDAYVVFRYARHLAEGDGVRFNAGDARPTEGCTSFLHLLAMTMIAAMKLNPVLGAKVLGLTATLLAAWGVYGLSLALATDEQGIAPRSRSGAALAALFYLSNGMTAVHAVSGMETALAGLFLICAAIFSVQFLTTGGAREAAVWGWSLLLLGLTRPEMNFVCLAAAAYIWVKSDAPARRRLLLSAGILYVFPGLVYFIWRWHYFGLFLPLPFHLKAARGFLRGIGPTLSFFTEAAVILPAVFICMVSQANRKRKLLLLLAISLALLFLQPRHLMGYSSRYLYPIFPMLVALGFSAFDRKAIALRWYLIPLLLASNLISFREVREARAYAKSHISGYRAIVQTLDTIHADEPSLAIGSAGFVPYKTEWRAVDIFGLNNRAIALDAGAWRKELWDRPPTVIVLVSRREEVYETLADADIAYFKEIYDAAIERGYRAERKFKFDDEYFTWVLVMPGVEIPPPETKPEGRPPANP